MDSIQYEPEDYTALLEMSSKKVLLVEGRTDKRLFQILLDEIFIKVRQTIPLDSIIIDSAEDLIKVDNAPSNRQKVELVCRSIQKTPLANKLIGFVDREFREFGIRGVPEDKLK